MANDVKYIGDSAIRGDELYIIHANNVSPFPRSDVYSIYYTDTGKTMELVDSLGFRNEVPIYQMIEGGDIEMDKQQYTNNLDGCYYDLEALKYALSKEAYRKLKRDDEDISEDISGIYFIEKDSGSCFSFDLDNTQERGLSAGWVDYTKDGYGQYEGGVLYEVDENVYAACTERNTTYVFGFQQFLKEVTCEMREKLGDGYRIEEMERDDLNSTKKHSLLIARHGEAIQPCFNMDVCYRYYRVRLDVATMVDGMIRGLQEDIYVKHTGIFDLSDWVSVKSRLHGRLVNTEKNQKFLREVPNREYLDLLIVYDIRVAEAAEGNFCSMQIRNEYMQMWDVEESTLYREFMKNMDGADDVLFEDLADILNGRKRAAGVR